MQYISVFDMLKVGIGPSSSHTLGPWKAALAFIRLLEEKQYLKSVSSIQIDFYGSLALTGIGHGSDIAVIMGLSGYAAETVDLGLVTSVPKQANESQTIFLHQEKKVSFDIAYLKSERLDFHPNGLIFRAFDDDHSLLLKQDYYSIGGGFVSTGQHDNTPSKKQPKFYCGDAKTLLSLCHQQNLSIAQLALENELCWQSSEAINHQLNTILLIMQDSLYKGCHTSGELPGGLFVKRRASNINKKLLHHQVYINYEEWLHLVSNSSTNFSDINKWISAFAMAVNEENAAFGRIVTAPTNGSAGVLPAVMHYMMCFAKTDYKKQDLFNFLLVSAQIGAFFKTNATISAAAGGCQAEIGVSSAMAAGALTEIMGGSVEQSLMAAEIAMEHHLGLTCDPIKGLVQVPCIERNSMGAIKAILASNLALETNPEEAKVSLDEVIQTMWETANDMLAKYKETSIGGLAVNVGLPEC